MKFLILLSALFVVEATINICIPPPSKTAANPDILKEIKDEIVQNLKADIEIDHADVNLTHDAIRLAGTVDNIKISNLTDVKISFLDNIFVNSSYYQFDPFNITFRNIRVEGLYNLTGDLGDFFDIYGAGDFWLELHNFSVSMVNLTFNVNDEICFPVNLNINLQAAANNFSNFMFDHDLEQLFNKCITSILPEVFHILWGEWQEIFDKPLEDAINNFLHHHDISSVFNLIKNMNSAQVLPPKLSF